MADTINPAVLHQAFQPFPKLDAPLVDPETGLITQSWYFLLIRLWQMVGSSYTPAPTGAVIKQTPTGLLAQDALTGQPIGSVPTPGSPAADQITFITFENSVPPDPVPTLSPTPAADVLALLPPQDSQRSELLLGLMISSMDSIAL